MAILLGMAMSVTPVGLFFARRAVVMLHIGEAGTVWKGPIPMLMGIAGTFVYSLPFAFLLIALSETLFGRSPDRWKRFFVSAAPWYGLTMALLVGSWVLAVLSIITGVALLCRAVISML